MPKNNPPSNVDIPVKKIKEKTKDVSDLALRNDRSSTVKTKKFGDNAWPKVSKLANIVTDATKERDPPTSRKLEPNPNTAPLAYSPKRPQKCIVCNVPNLGRRGCRDHFAGERHTQVRGLLEIHGENAGIADAAMRDAAMRDAAQSSSAVVAFGDGCYCYVCGSPIRPRNNDNLRKHLGKESHLEKLKKMWEDFLKNAIDVVGLRRYEVPRDAERTFV